MSDNYSSFLVDKDCGTLIKASNSKDQKIEKLLLSDFWMVGNAEDSSKSEVESILSLLSDEQAKKKEIHCDKCWEHFSIDSFKD